MNGPLYNSNCTESRRLLQETVRRLYLAALGTAWLGALMKLWGGLFFLLLLSRLGGVVWEWFSLEVLVVTPLLAALFALLVVRRPTELEAARRIDGGSSEPELFLTLAQLESSAGMYQPILADRAEKRAAEIRPSEVVIWNWRRRIMHPIVGAAIVAGTGQYLPQLDPFDMVASRQSVISARRDLLESRRETEFRTAELASLRESSALSSQVDSSLAELAAEIQRFRTDRAPASEATWDAQQEKIQTLWRDLRQDDDVDRLIEQTQSSQFFGGTGQQWQQWTDEIVEGQTAGVDESFESLEETLDQLVAKTEQPEPSEAEQQRLIREARQAVASLQRFAGTHLKSRPAESALKRAMSQLDAAQHGAGLQKEGLDAARQSVELAQAELQEVARKAGQLAALEQALGAVQSAKQLAANNAAGEASGADQTMQQFVEQYANLNGPSDANESSRGSSRESVEPSTSSENRDAAGEAGAETDSAAVAGGSSRATETDEGQPGASLADGSGQPNHAPENDQARTGFQSAREFPNEELGRRLMSLRRQGLADAGSASVEYRELVQTLQKNISSTIEIEEIPPGYVSGIQKYFDSLARSSTPVDSDPAVEQQSDGSAERANESDDANESAKGADEGP